jgi:glycosyltransferase involved in cell wall biosynthesis
MASSEFPDLSPLSGEEQEPRSVAHLSSVHRPSETRLNKECRTLADAGYHAVIVAPYDESIDARLELWSLPTPRSRPARMTRTVLQVYRRARKLENAALFHIHDVELIPIGFLLKLHRKTVIYDVPEDMPRDVFNRPWLAPWARRPVATILAFAEWIAGRYLDAVVPATPVIARRFPPHKTTLVQNFPELDEFGWVARSRLTRNNLPGGETTADLLRFVYVGWCDEGRGIGTMVRAMELIPSEVPVELVVAGDFSEQSLALEMQRRPGWKRVRFLGWQARPAVAEVLVGAVAGLAILQPTQAIIEGQSTKVFEYMAAGLAVITSDFPVWRRFVGANQSGVLIDPESPQAVADAMMSMINHPEDALAMGRRGRETIEGELNWTAEAAHLLDLYDRLIGRRRLHDVDGATQ